MRSLNIVVTCCSFVYQYYSLLLGINAIRYDRQQRRVIRSRAKIAYSRMANFALIVGMLYGYYTIIRMPAALYARGHELLRLMDLLSIAVQFCMTIWMFLLRFQREQKYMDIIVRFYNLDDDYMNRLSANGELQNAVLHLVCGKYVVMLTRMIMAFVIPMQLTSPLTWTNCLVIFQFANMQNFLQAIAFRYFFALLQAWKRFRMLNIELQRLLVQCDDTSVATTIDELWQLMRVHWQVSQLLQMLSETFKYQMIGTLLTYLIRNIAFTFFASLIIAGRIQMDTITITLGVLTFCANYADVYLLYWISESLQCVYMQTIQILREYHTVNIHVEWLCLQLTQSRLQVSMGGMFNLNMQALLSLLAYILQQTLIWIQFEWEHYEVH